jgi:hypothetical protein
MEKTDIDEVLDKWYRAKQDIAELEAKCEKYKRFIKKIMDSKDVNNVTGSRYKVQRRNIERETLSKEKVPVEVWKKYATKSSYESFYVNSR